MNIVPSNPHMHSTHIMCMVELDTFCASKALTGQSSLGNFFKVQLLDARFRVERRRHWRKRVLHYETFPVMTSHLKSSSIQQKKCNGNFSAKFNGEIDITWPQHQLSFPAEFSGRVSVNFPLNLRRIFPGFIQRVNFRLIQGEIERKFPD